jgi:hypothetical protein
LRALDVSALDPEEVGAVLRLSTLCIQPPATGNAPCAAITPSAPDSGTTSSAVNESDLFLVLMTEASLKALHAAKQRLPIAASELGTVGQFRIATLDRSVRR